MSKIKAKVVGLSYNRLSKPLGDGEQVLVVEDSNNDFDADALAVYTTTGNELVGFIANSDRTLSVNNRKNGSRSATELKFLLDWDNKKYSADILSNFRSCVYIEIDSESFQYVDESLVNESDSLINELKIKVQALEIQNTMLSERVKALEGLMNVGK